MYRHLILVVTSIISYYLFNMYSTYISSKNSSNKGNIACNFNGDVKVWNQCEINNLWLLKDVPGECYFSDNYHEATDLFESLASKINGLEKSKLTISDSLDSSVVFIKGGLKDKYMIHISGNFCLNSKMIL